MCLSANTTVEYDCCTNESECMSTSIYDKESHAEILWNHLTYVSPSLRLTFSKDLSLIKAVMKKMP